jgi:SAM-dependent methyltransferase
MVADQLTDLPRIAFHIELVSRRKGVNIDICDIGGGVGLFSLGCAALGMRSILVDDFQDEINRTLGKAALALHERSRVKVISCDVINDRLDFESESLDAVTTFDAMEHWHHSPKKLFHKVMEWLRPGGLLIIGVPNCVNLRKRLAVPLGYGGWSSLEDWYEQPLFRGHVREPELRDLQYIGKDLGLTDIKLYGRNWLGRGSRRAVVRLGTRLIDPVLKMSPSLCSNLYLVGRKPQR